MNEANRVLTLDELNKMTVGSKVWVEVHDEEPGTGYGNDQYEIGDEDNLICVIEPYITPDFSITDDSEDGKAYNKNDHYGWRAWLREPTTEESAAVAWEGE